LFFIAGYFAFPSLVRSGPRRFWRDKLIRVGLPWVFGVLVLAPPTAYLIYFSRGVPMTLLQFWRTDFWGAMYQQSVYWYLGFLFLMFTVLSLVYALCSRVRVLKRRGTVPSWRLFVTFAGLTTAGFLSMNLFFPLDTWTHVGYIFTLQPLRVPLYIGYFLLGMYACRNSWFTTDGYNPSLDHWTLPCMLSGLFYVACRLLIPSTAQTTIILKAGRAVLFNAFCLSSLMFGVAFFQLYFNGAGAFWKSQGRNSYGIYYVHPLFLYPLALIFVQVSLPIFLKATAIIVLTFLLSWGFSALVLRKAPFLDRAF
jgi:glucan biosynthesis protein C